MIAAECAHEHCSGERLAVPSFKVFCRQGLFESVVVFSDSLRPLLLRLCSLLPGPESR